MKATFNFIAFFFCFLFKGLFVLICSAAAPKYNQISPSLNLGVSQGLVVLLFNVFPKFLVCFTSFASPSNCISPLIFHKLVLHASVKLEFRGAKEALTLHPTLQCKTMLYKIFKM